VFDFSNGSIPSASPAAPSIVNNTMAKAKAFTSSRSRRVGSPMRVSDSRLPNRESFVSRKCGSIVQRLA